jgi:hypothetical protein
MKLKARRGAVVVLLGIMIVALVSVSAISIDFSRLWSLRNELQTSADAAAHAGAIQLSAPNNAGNTISTATAYANVNLAMAGTVTVDSVELGDWDDAVRSFTPGASHTDAVRVVVSRQSTGLIMGLMGVAAPRIKARAIGWADAPISDAVGCIKPWAVPYVVLMYRLNLYHNSVNPGTYSPPDSWANLTRPFDQVDDIAALGNMTVAQRTFNLKMGSTNPNGANGINDSVTSAMPGNYNAVILPKLRDSAGVATSPTPQGGADNYRDHISGTSCEALNIGDVLGTQPGNMTQPTIQGVTGQAPATGPGFCTQLKGETDNTNINDPTFGDCLDANGTQPSIKAAFYYCSSGCGGASEVTVKLLGSFTLMKIYPRQKNGVFDKAEIVGVFNPTGDPGTVGAGSTTYVRPIIVR